MSAPDTNIERQEKRHKPALLGMGGAVAFGAIMLLLIIAFGVMRGGDASIEEVYNEEGTAAGTATEFDTYQPGTNDSN